MTIDSRAGDANDPAGRYSGGRYPDANETWGEEDSPYKANLVKAAIARNSIPFVSCVDVGCGAGLVTEILAKEYPDKSFVGYDVSSDAKKFWDHRIAAPNLKYLNESFLNIDKQYDLVLCLDVFEHIDDYFGFLRALRTKGKQFIFNIPLDMNVIRIIAPGIKHVRERHGALHYFNEYSAIETLRDCGYEVRDHFLSGSFAQLAPKNIQQALVALPRLVLMGFGNHLPPRFSEAIAWSYTARAGPETGRVLVGSRPASLQCFSGDPRHANLARRHLPIPRGTMPTLHPQSRVATSVTHVGSAENPPR